MKRLLYKWFFLGLLGWRITGSFDPSIKKSVLMILPHTSMLDFFVGMFARGIIGLEMHYVAKKEFFRFPLGGWFRWMGGTALDRSGGKNKVDEIVKIFDSREVFRMAIAPEGTRKKVNTIRTGFYYIAMKAGVPIIPVAFDYSKKEVRIGEAFYLTGDADNDLRLLLRHFAGAKGFHPENSFDAEKFNAN